VTQKLLEAIVRLDDPRQPIAETARRVGRVAEQLGLTRPSYERIRTLVHAARALRRRRGPTTGEVLVDIAFRVRPPDALLDHLSGVGLPPYDEAAGFT
jgi:hypothetical protein